MSSVRIPRLCGRNVVTGGGGAENSRTAYFRGRHVIPQTRPGTPGLTGEGTPPLLTLTFLGPRASPTRGLLPRTQGLQKKPL